MAVIATMPAGHDLPRPLVLLRGLAASIAEGLRAHHRCQQLARLDDAQLAARGITRLDIPRVAMFGAPRR